MDVSKNTYKAPIQCESGLILVVTEAAYGVRPSETAKIVLLAQNFPSLSVVNAMITPKTRAVIPTN